MTIKVWISTIALLVSGAALASISSSAFAQDAQAQGSCIQKTLELKQVLSNEINDPALTGYINLIPQMKDQIATDLANPYRCSL